MTPDSQSWEWPDAEAIGREPALESEVVSLLSGVIEGTNRLGFASTDAPKAARWLLDYILAVSRLGLAQWLVCRSVRGVILSVILERGVAPSQRHIASVRFLAVQQERRALRLLKVGAEHVVARCREVGIEELRVDTRSGSPLERLWRMFGFKQYARIDGYARVSGALLPGVFLRQPVEDLAARVARWREGEVDARASAKPEEKAPTDIRG
jgi:hypothetical protein